MRLPVPRALIYHYRSNRSDKLCVIYINVYIFSQFTYKFVNKMLRDSRSQNKNKKNMLGKEEVSVSIAGAVWHRSEITSLCGAATLRQFSKWNRWHSSNRCDSIHVRRKHNKDDLFPLSIIGSQTEIRSQLVVTPWCVCAGIWLIECKRFPFIFNFRSLSDRAK